MYLAGYIVTGFLVAGAYAVGRLRGRWGRYERTALAIPLTIAAVASPVQVLVGDWAAREVAERQPTKLAAIEGLPHTTRGAPLHLLGWYTDGKVKYGIAIPSCSRCSPSTTRSAVQGLDAVPADRPPAGQRRPGRFPDAWSGSARCSRYSASSTSPPRRRDGCPTRAGSTARSPPPDRCRVVALIAGWVTTEVGRQPWVVYRVMRTSQAVTGADGIPVGYATLAAVYLLRRGARSSGSCAGWRARRSAAVAPSASRPER